MQTIGVMAGVTPGRHVWGYYMQDGERIPMPGQLIYRGIDVSTWVDGFISEAPARLLRRRRICFFSAICLTARR